MIENLRKYTVLIIILFVLVLIGFLFMDYGHQRGPSGGAPYIKVAGRTYTDKEFNHLGSSSYQLTQSLAQGLMQSGDFQLFTFMFNLGGNNPMGSDEAVNEFFANRIILRSAKEEFGIHPGDAEIDSFIRRLPPFIGPDGAFSQEQFRTFLEKGIGRLGLTEADVRDLVSDVIAYRKLNEIIGSGLTGNAGTVAKRVAIQSQRISASVARIDIDPITAKIDPPEDKIKTYWETVQDAFRTPEKRRFSYIIAKPEFPEEPAEIPAPAADATPEAKAEFETKKTERDAKIAEDRRVIKFDNDKKMEGLYDALIDEKSPDFAKIVKEKGFELKTTELFAAAEPPAELKVALRSSSSQGTATDELFRMKVTSDPFSKISPAIAIGEAEWLIAVLEETEDSRVQTYPEARAEARARLISDEATAGLKKAADEATEKIKASLAEGKTFAEAAKAAGIEIETVSLPEVTQGYQGDTTKIPSSLFSAAQYTDPGSLADPIIESDRAFIVLVEKREVVKTDTEAETVKAEITRAAESNKIAAFTAWLNARNEAADIQMLGKR